MGPLEQTIKKGKAAWSAHWPVWIIASVIVGFILEKAYSDFQSRKRNAFYVMDERSRTEFFAASMGLNTARHISDPRLAFENLNDGEIYGLYMNAFDSAKNVNAAHFDKVHPEMARHFRTEFFAGLGKITEKNPQAFVEGTGLLQKWDTWCKNEVRCNEEMISWRQ